MCNTPDWALIPLLGSTARQNLKYDLRMAFDEKSLYVAFKQLSAGFRFLDDPSRFFRFSASNFPDKKLLTPRFTCVKSDLCFAFVERGVKHG